MRSSVASSSASVVTFPAGAIPAASLALHRALGFEHAGTIRAAGFKFGRWLDLEFWQLCLATPTQPLDG